MKTKAEVIKEFNLQINMSVDELQAWLDNPQSKTAGTGVGLDSGHKILDILKRNPDKDPELYDEEDIDHMRKVVGYNKRHVAQEDHLKETKTKEQLENTKSTISLKNWGHDPVKTLEEETKTDVKASEEPEKVSEKSQKEATVSEKSEKKADIPEETEDTKGEGSNAVSSEKDNQSSHEQEDSSAGTKRKLDSVAKDGEADDDKSAEKAASDKHGEGEDSVEEQAGTEEPVKKRTKTNEVEGDETQDE